MLCIPLARESVRQAHTLFDTLKIYGYCRTGMESSSPVQSR